MKHHKHRLLGLFAIILMVLVGCQQGNVDNATDQTTPTESSTTTETVSDNEVLETNDTITTITPEEEPVIVTPTFGGTLRLAIHDPASLNPIENSIQSVAQVLDMVYEPLFQLDDTWKPVPVLVDTYNFSDTGNTLTLKLKEGVLFHNGTELTANDVVYTIEAIEDADYSPYSNNVLGFKRVSLVDDYTLEFQYDQGYAFALSDLTFPILSATYHESDDYASNMPIGTGPYKFVDYQQMQSLSLEANQSWHNGDVYVASIVCTVITEERSYETLFDQYLIDTMTPTKFNWLKYSENETQHIDSYVSSYYDFLAFNFNNSLFDDINIRKAFAHAIDREHIVYDRFINHAVIADTPVRPGSWFSSEKDLDFSYNLSEATSLLPHTLVDKDGDGYFEEQDLVDETLFNTIELTMLVNQAVPHRFETANLIKENIEAMGFKVTINSLPPESYYEAATSGDFDLLYGGWKLSAKPDYVAILDTYGAQNLGRYSSEMLDASIDGIIDAYTEEQVVSAVEKFETVFVEELPYVSLYFLEGAIMSHNNVYGEFKGDTTYMFRGIEDIYLDITQ